MKEKQPLLLVQQAESVRVWQKKFAKENMQVVLADIEEDALEKTNKKFIKRFQFSCRNQDRCIGRRFN